MKKIQSTILICFLAFNTLMVSCKKEAEVVAANETTKTLLTKKWYVLSYINNYTATNKLFEERKVFSSTSTMEFKADNTFIDNFYFDNDPYSFTLSADGKIATITIPNSSQKTYNFNITKITATELEFNFIDGTHTIYLILSTATQERP